MPGVQYRGAVPHEGLPASLAGVDAYVLPYEINNLTKGISPAKTYECLATGKPVVASPLPALRESRRARVPRERAAGVRGRIAEAWRARV